MSLRKRLSIHKEILICRSLDSTLSFSARRRPCLIPYPPPPPCVVANSVPIQCSVGRYSYSPSSLRQFCSNLSDFQGISSLNWKTVFSAHRSFSSKNIPIRRSHHHNHHHYNHHPQHRNNDPRSMASTSPLFDIYVVLDFEATCEREKRIRNQEIIEFPMVIVDARTATPVAEFQRYVRPVLSTTLSEFCTELTGITQSVVDRAEPFPVVLAEVLRFLQTDVSVGSGPMQRSMCFVTCGNWDLRTMLPTQLRHVGKQPQSLPSYFHYWVNLKHVMQNMDQSILPGAGPRGTHHIGSMEDMMHALQLQGVGRAHSGIDDCRNIAAVLCELLRRKVTVKPTYFEKYAPQVSTRLAQDAHGTELGAITPGSIPSSIVPKEMCPPESTFDPKTVENQSKRSAPVPRQENRPREVRRAPNTSEKSGTGSHPSQSQGKAANNSQPPVRFHIEVLADVNPVDDHAAELSTMSINSRDDVRISKALSRVLRHAADEMHIAMSDTGLVKVDDLLRLPVIKRLGATPVMLMAITNSNSKQRFRMCYANDGKKTLYIGATQGHSLEGVFPDLHPITSVSQAPVAIHGTYHDAWKAIQACGYLSTMNRQHIHFAKGLVHDGEVISGMRSAVQVFIYLNVEKALADGIPLFESSNGVILTPGVGSTRQLPLAYISKAVDRTSKRIIYPETTQ